jgi:hypothetical protein
MQGVYLLRYDNWTINEYKIGRSKNIKNRLKAYNTSNGKAPDMIMVLECEDHQEREKHYHIKFKNQKQLDSKSREHFVLSKENVEEMIKSGFETYSGILEFFSLENEIEKLQTSCVKETTLTVTDTQEKINLITEKIQKECQDKLKLSSEKIQKEYQEKIQSSTEKIQKECQNKLKVSTEKLQTEYQDRINLIKTIYDDKLLKLRNITMDDIILNTNEIQTELQEEKEMKYIKQEEKETIDSNFNEWLYDNIMYKEKGTLTLFDVCESFLGEKIASRIATNYKKEIESHIKKEYKEVNHEYKQFKTHRGWKDIVLVKENTFDIDSKKFINWMDENIIYKVDSILKLSDVCEVFLKKISGPRIMSKYKDYIQNYIKIKFTTTDYIYKQYTLCDKTKCRGRKNIALKEQIKND